MKNIKYIGLSLVITLSLGFSGCGTKQTFVRTSDKVVLSGNLLSSYENFIGKNRTTTFYSNTVYDLDRNNNKSNAICIKRPLICIIDANNTGMFTQTIVRRKIGNTIFTIENPIKYKILHKLLLDDYNYHLSTELKIVNIPMLGELSTREIGASMYEKFNIYALDEYHVVLNDIAKGSLKEYDISSEKSFTIPSKTIYKELTKTYDGLGLTVCKDGRCLIDKDNIGKFTHSSPEKYNDLTLLDNPVRYTIVQEQLINQDSFKYQALYQGKIGNKIKISFREFKDDMARAAFTQDIEYELNKEGNTVVGFKGLRIEVIKATNLDITYKVIKDYS